MPFYTKMNIALCISLFIVLVSWKGCFCSSNSDRNVSEDPEIYMNTTQLITSKGYPCEEYDVHTHDGYIINVQRIPNGRNKTKSGLERPVVFLLHGLVSCSACWVENLVNESFGFILADAGYDVWLGNSRGNTYGRRHEKLDPSQKEFWNFSWDDMAMYDLPDTVNKILAVTGAKQIYFVGYSQGGLIGYTQLIRDPDLARKIKLFVALAPSVYLDAIKGPFRTLSRYTKDIDFFYSLFGEGEFMPHDEIYTFLAKDVCDKEIPSYLCKNLLFVLAGFDEKQINKTRVPVYIGQNPAGTSVKNINHFSQLVNSGKFQAFDYGPTENMNKYNKTTPPEYDPSKVTVPVAMFSGTNDWLVVPSDVNKLLNVSTTVVFNKVINGWEHLDFIWALDSPGQCYNDVMQLFKKYN